ncbi:Hypothetical protein NTJ_06779 [Nesidiocoris tenuis]|uniref:Uncharacterized protein n=1 Tax=Nesidiocoris tenuis TaxID=355587 RepID=A0ABN7AP24_9HEMI|nr:Hypothetical protein NTJ_06779 [Nesidiocoris tenuis]
MHRKADSLVSKITFFYVILKVTSLVDDLKKRGEFLPVTGRDSELDVTRGGIPLCQEVMPVRDPRLGIIPDSCPSSLPFVLFQYSVLSRENAPEESCRIQEQREAMDDAMTLGSSRRLHFPY